MINRKPAYTVPSLFQTVRFDIAYVICQSVAAQTLNRFFRQAVRAPAGCSAIGALRRRSCKTAIPDPHHRRTGFLFGQLRNSERTRRAVCALTVRPAHSNGNGKPLQENTVNLRENLPPQLLRSAERSASASLAVPQTRLASKLFLSETGDGKPNRGLRRPARLYHGPQKNAIQKREPVTSLWYRR